MSKSAKALREKFRRRLARYVGMEIPQCGREGPAREAAFERERLIYWIFEEVGKCERAAVIESVRDGGRG